MGRYLSQNLGETKAMKLRILLAGDNKAFRDGLRRFLELQPNCQVIAEVANGRAAVEQALLMQPDVAILDYSMPEIDGLSAALKIREAALRIEVIVLTQHDAPYTVQRALNAGVSAYVAKSDASQDLLAALEAVRQHKVFISSTISRALYQRDE